MWEDACRGELVHRFDSVAQGPRSDTGSAVNSGAGSAAGSAGGAGSAAEAQLPAPLAGAAPEGPVVRAAPAAPPAVMVRQPLTAGLASGYVVHGASHGPAQPGWTSTGIPGSGPA